MNKLTYSIYFKFIINLTILKKSIYYESNFFQNPFSVCFHAKGLVNFFIFSNLLKDAEENLLSILDEDSLFLLFT